MSYIHVWPGLVLCVPIFACATLIPWQILAKSWRRSCLWRVTILWKFSSCTQRSCRYEWIICTLMRTHTHTTCSKNSMWVYVQDADMNHYCILRLCRYQDEHALAYFKNWIDLDVCVRDISSLAHDMYMMQHTQEWYIAAWIAERTRARSHTQTHMHTNDPCQHE